MQTIPHGSRMMVSMRHRCERKWDDAFWTGTITKHDCAAGMVLVCFDEDTSIWYAPSELEPAKS